VCNRVQQSVHAVNHTLALPNGEVVELRHRLIDGVSLLLANGPSPDDEDMQSHEKTRLNFLMNGMIAETDDRHKTVERGRFSVQITPANAPHAHAFLSKRLECLCVELETSELSMLAENGAVFKSSQTLDRGVAMAIIPRLRREMFRDDPASDLVLKGLVYELAGELLRGRESSPPDPPFWLTRARELLSDTWRQNARIEDVAREVGVHPSHLLRAFRVYMNETPGAFVRKLRMEHVTREVLVSDLPLKAIAVNAGYADQAHFSRDFKRQHGVTPDQMRRSSR
jgi:AraC family transcriptional regulator